MTTTWFLTLLMVISSLSALTTQAVKIILDEHGKNYHANTLAGICAIVVSIIAVGLIIWSGNYELSLHTMPQAIALVLLSWLCAMVGYDKVVQAITQFQKED